ncbi:MAG: type II toxin-antitoxin system VapC family toxin [Methanosarcinales archaeon]|nr:MAG: type II toxin-antitoxin system VapC family toxin [Methanosarcinales archaeon]
MGGYLFDTMVHVHAYDNIPERWYKQWKDATVGNKRLILSELLIAEILYQMIQEKGDAAATDRILWVKSRQNTRIVALDDKIAFAAGRAYIKFKGYGLSIVDSFSLVIAKEEKAEIFTTDPGLLKAGDDYGVKVNFLPKKALKR